MVWMHDIVTIVVLCRASGNETEMDGYTYRSQGFRALRQGTQDTGSKHIFIKWKGNTV